MPDPISLTAIAAALGISKTLIASFKKAGDSERAAQLIEIMTALVDAREEITDLQGRIKTLEDNSALGERLTFHKNAYWLDMRTSSAEGPFCSACWNSKSKLVRLLHTPASYDEEGDPTNPHLCPVCKSQLQTLIGPPRD